MDTRGAPVAIRSDNGSNLLLAEPRRDPRRKAVPVLVKAGIGDVPLGAAILKEMPEGVGDDHRLFSLMMVSVAYRNAGIRQVGKNWRFCQL